MIGGDTGDQGTRVIGGDTGDQGTRVIRDVQVTRGPG